MSMVIALLRDVAGLFVDDGSLALAIVGVVVIAAIVAALAPTLPLAAGATLLLGCVSVLLVNVMRAPRN